MWRFMSPVMLFQGDKQLQRRIIMEQKRLKEAFYFWSGIKKRSKI